MINSHIDIADAGLLDAVQSNFPVTGRPYEALAADLAMTEAQVIERLTACKQSGILREISAIFNSATLGYCSSLVAFEVAEDELDMVAAVVCSHAGVSHCYSRDHRYNLWFTITAPSHSSLAEDTTRFASLNGVISSMILPAVKLYKIGVRFNVSGDSLLEQEHRPKPEIAQKLIDQVDIPIIRALQVDLPLSQRPFGEIGLEYGLSEAEVLSGLVRLQRSGVVRRYGAVLRHKIAGFRANCLVCWIVSEEFIDDIGAKLSENAAVSHCYSRPTFPDWPYNLYTMIHAHSDEELENVLEALRTASCDLPMLPLRTQKEYKKCRVK